MARVKYRQLLRMLHDDGWRRDRTKGSHIMYVHPTKPGPVVVPAGGKEAQEVPPGTLNMSEATSYVYVVERSEDGSYWAYLPDLPGCTTTADSPDDIEAKLKEAVDLYLSYYRDRGQPAPPAHARVGRLTAA